MEKTDALVLAAFADKVLTREGMGVMLKEMKMHLKNAQARQDDTLGPLQKELKELETATNRLF